MEAYKQQSGRTFQLSEILSCSWFTGLPWAHLEKPVGTWSPIRTEPLPNESGVEIDTHERDRLVLSGRNASSSSPVSVSNSESRSVFQLRRKGSLRASFFGGANDCTWRVTGALR